jgi:hypothetical protein
MDNGYAFGDPVKAQRMAEQTIQTAIWEHILASQGKAQGQNAEG